MSQIDGYIEDGYETIGMYFDAHITSRHTLICKYRKIMFWYIQKRRFLQKEIANGRRLEHRLNFLDKEFTLFMNLHKRQFILLDMNRDTKGFQLFNDLNYSDYI